MGIGARPASISFVSWGHPLAGVVNKGGGIPAASPQLSSTGRSLAGVNDQRSRRLGRAVSEVDPHQSPIRIKASVE